VVSVKHEYVIQGVRVDLVRCWVPEDPGIKGLALLLRQSNKSEGDDELDYLFVMHHCLMI
ncbi:MAG: hypothetical protein KDD45_06050, partial [Bdellovibrionales bacterium]|nr:hypothetical protein [Bdellovibrionales bacterium]